MRTVMPVVGSLLILASGCCEGGQVCGGGGTEPPPGVTAIKVGDGDGQVAPAGQFLTSVILVRYV